MRLRAGDVREGHRFGGGTVVETGTTADGVYVFLCVEHASNTPPRTTITCWHNSDELDVEQAN